LSANSRIDNFSTRLSRLICSNNSTLDLAIPTPTLDNIDAEIASGVGPTFATTRRPPTQRDHHPGGADIRDETRPSRGQVR
jgi:hypothetical protein